MTFRSVVLPERYDLTRVDVERNVTQCVDTGLALAEVLRDPIEMHEWPIYVKKPDGSTILGWFSQADEAAEFFVASTFERGQSQSQYRCRCTRRWMQWLVPALMTLRPSATRYDVLRDGKDSAMLNRIGYERLGIGYLCMAFALTASRYTASR